MKKKTIKYSDLSKKQLQELKELYIKKVACMSHKELTEFVLEIISHQINDTIGREEEMEAWEEMSIFYGINLNLLLMKFKKNMQKKKT